MHIFLKNAYKIDHNRLFTGLNGFQRIKITYRDQFIEWQREDFGKFCFHIKTTKIEAKKPNNHL